MRAHAFTPFRKMCVDKFYPPNPHDERRGARAMTARFARFLCARVIVFFHCLTEYILDMVEYGKACF